MARPQTETTTLVFAVCVAVALGVACGVWINTSLTAAASKTVQAPARLMPAATAEQTAPASPGGPESLSDDSRRAASETGSDASPVDSNPPAESRTQSHPAATDAAHKDRPAPAPAPPITREANRSEKSPAARVEGREVKAEPGSRPRAGAAAPCSPYASAGSLTLRGGGAAALVVGGPGEAGRVTVTTPDWADIAVFSEGRAGGNGWVRYSVRSVGKRPGVYTLHFKTPCGSQSIPVTVTRP
jgi:cytoskeletal protein RodZ